MGPKRTRSLSNKTKRTKSVIIQTPSHVQKDSIAQKQKQNFKFISEEYSKYLNCPLCKQLMIQPQRFHPCGHTFCLNCIQHIKKLSRKFCPLQTCLSKCVQIQVDRTAQSLIDELKVACTNIGCQWKGEYDNFKKTHRDSCPLKGIGLDKFLQELSRIPIVARCKKEASQQNDQNNEKDENRITQSEHLLNQQQWEQIECHADQIKQQQPDYFHKDYCQQVQEDNKAIRLQANQESVQQEKVQEKVEEKVQEKKQSEFIQQELSPIRNINHNNLINFINLPFGPPISATLEISSLQKQQYLSKKLKKIQ